VAGRNWLLSLEGETLIMTFKVQVGPPLISIHQGHTVLVSEQDGRINWPSEKGFYFFDTRIVSSWAIYASGEPWELLNGGAIAYYASRIFLTNRSSLTEDGTIPPRTLGCTVSRSISGGMHEDLDVTNNGIKPVKFQLEIALRCDFADIFEVKSGILCAAAGSLRAGPNRINDCAQPTCDFDARAATVSNGTLANRGGVRQRRAQL
jgi:hypothetical protein